MRLVCRECRLRKCYSAGMRPECELFYTVTQPVLSETIPIPVVRSKRENFACTRRKDSRNNSDAGFLPNGDSPSNRQSSSPEDDEWSFQTFEEKPRGMIEDPKCSVSLPPPPSQLVVSRWADGEYFVLCPDAIRCSLLLNSNLLILVSWSDLWKFHLVGVL